MKALLIALSVGWFVLVCWAIYVDCRDSGWGNPRTGWRAKQ